MELKRSARENVFVRKSFYSFFLPSLCSCLGLAIGGLADCVFVGNVVGPVGLTAISIGQPIYMLFNTISYSLSIGGSIRYAAALNWEYDPSLLGTPLFLAAGTGLLDAGDTGAPETMEPEVAEEAQEISIAPLWSQEEIYAQVPAVTPKLRARRAGADHAEMLYWGDGYMTAWFMYWLQGDEAAGRAFFGSGAELLQNPLWQDVEKNL